MSDFEKYHKKENCSYPFTNDPLGYCWGYADKGCEYYEEEI